MECSGRRVGVAQECVVHPGVGGSQEHAVQEIGDLLGCMQCSRGRTVHSQGPRALLVQPVAT